MITAPQPAKYTPSPSISEVPGLTEVVKPASFPAHVLRFRNDRWAQSVGLEGLSNEEWIAHFGAFQPLTDNLPHPLALRYHGHQFRVYNPDIGDGRGFLFAQLRDGAGRLMDLGTKGSGQTPYSRFGDGRLTLKGGVREILATEMLEALGVNTSKTFSLIETGEALQRNDEPSPTRSAVMVRLSHSHIRIGSFQRAAALGEQELLRDLVQYSLTRLYEVEAGSEPAVQLLNLVVERTADLAASYMIAGFVHGVLNSDNINITGESFDYGPWRFTPKWEPGFTAAYFDHQGLYAFGRQAEAIYWDVAQLAVSLRMLTEAEPLIETLERFSALYADAMRRRFCWRLGVSQPDDETASQIMENAVSAMIETETEIDRFFFDWRGGELRNQAAKDRYAEDAWDNFRALIEATQSSANMAHPYWNRADPCSMHIGEVERLWTAIDKDDDWTPLETKIEDIRFMREALSHY